MKESTSKAKILRKVRNALIFKDVDSFPDVDLDSPVHHTSSEAPEIRFAQNFTELTGKFAFCENRGELRELIWDVLREKGIKEVFCREQQVRKLLEELEVPFNDDPDLLTKHQLTITLCESLIARTGSVLMSSAQESGRKLHAYPEIHIVLATSDQIVPDISDALAGLRSRYGEKIPSLVSLISGPSRTADIEKTLVLGAHGPKEIFVFLMDKIN